MNNEEDLNPEKLAQAAGALFYTLPSELTEEQVDPLLRMAVGFINSSGWIWTAESCQGHPDEADLHAAWGHNVEPYLRLVCRGVHLGTALTALLTNAGDEEDAILGAPQMKLSTRPLRHGWFELKVYVVAHNVATRNRGCEALTRFGRVVLASPQSLPAAP